MGEKLSPLFVNKITPQAQKNAELSANTDPTMVYPFKKSLKVKLSLEVGQSFFFIPEFKIDKIFICLGFTGLGFLSFIPQGNGCRHEYGKLEISIHTQGILGFTLLFQTCNHPGKAPHAMGNGLFKSKDLGSKPMEVMGIVIP